MGNWLVIPKGTSLARRTRARRAAQYVRMSRELQRYSIKNQMAAIAAYAEANTLTIVRTYADEGRSGLRIKGRPGLIELIEDVQSGQADFDHILVYDVSRWGRFQDVDESAYVDLFAYYGIRPWTLHDIRRTLGEFLDDKRLGGAASAILGHKLPRDDMPERERMAPVTEIHYNSSQRIALKAEGMALWTRALLAACEKERKALARKARPALLPAPN